MHEARHTAPGEPPQLQHETSDAAIGAVVKFGLVLAMICVVVLVLMFFIAGYFEKRTTAATRASTPLAGQRVLPPDPRVQVQPEKDLEHLRAVEDSVLHSYGWVMREANVVRIPIARAIELTAQRGLPLRTEEGGSKMEDRGSMIENGGSHP